jgi:hypothetical protein
MNAQNAKTFLIFLSAVSVVLSVRIIHFREDSF